MNMKFEISVKISVDPSANFLETYGNNVDVIAELINLSLYDIDDIVVEECEVKRYD